MKITFPWRRLGLIIGGLILAVLISPAQSQPSLAITSPSANTVFAPGQAIPVVVQAVGSFQQVTIFAQAPLQTDQVLTQPPYEFSVNVPTTTSPGAYAITAFGALGPGSSVKSAPLVIRVESAKPLISLKTDLSQIQFGFVGDQEPVLVQGIFADATSTDLSNSQDVTYTSSNPAVVTVDNTGLATATGSGNASIRVQDGSLFVDVAVVVPSTVRGDLNGDGKVDRDDLNILFDALNTPATRPVDARDLNSDGVINALDARILVTLCSSPSCSVK